MQACSIILTSVKIGVSNEQWLKVHGLGTRTGTMP